MRNVLDKMIQEMRASDSFDAKSLDKLLRAESKARKDGIRLAKKHLLPVYLRMKSEFDELFASWNLSEDEDFAILELLRQKPRRTASGVATLTVLTKPWACSNDCLYCPNDIRMPKSYMSDEPACQRAERCCFDPYLQVVSRLSVLTDMGHETDKVELIILGGTWSDYPLKYREWFITGLFAALNDFGSDAAVMEARRRRRVLGIDDVAHDHASEDSSLRESLQQRVNLFDMSYNQAISILQEESNDPVYAKDIPSELSFDSTSEEEQVRNESADHRCVGLVIETQPEAIDHELLIELRHMGCTKVQIGIQSLDECVLKANERRSNVESIKRAMSLLRLYGFKTHVHLMANLLGSTPEKDKDIYRSLVQDECLIPDEVKLYPCSLVESSRLMNEFDSGDWHPYTEDELIDVLSYCLQVTPPYTRVSRMIRDISSKDIVAGNKKTNLRQIVEHSLEDKPVNEMRIREISTSNVDTDALSLEEVSYETVSTYEYFLQWVTPQNGLAAFLRLSIPKEDAIVSEIDAFDAFPIKPGQAMIREVHVYGKVSKLHESKTGAQHIGLGRKMISRAFEIAASHDMRSVNVISAIGTREYYRSLGFSDSDLYLNHSLEADC